MSNFLERDAEWICAALSGIPAAGFAGDALTEITCVCCDSRSAEPGALFVCLPGRHTDGSAYAAQAAAGAAAVLCGPGYAGRDLPDRCAVLQADDPRRMMAVLSARLYGDPGGQMTLVGITGTKGKTTTAHLLAAILQADGRRVGLIGTNGACWPGHRHDLNHTTPESCDLQALLRRMADDGCDTCIMEVSSLGLKAGRVAGWRSPSGCSRTSRPTTSAPGSMRIWQSICTGRRRSFRTVQPEFSTMMMHGWGKSGRAHPAAP